MTEVELFPTVTIDKDDDAERALRVLRKTEEACLITNSIKAKVTMHPIIELVPVTRKP